jgi:hypothetical protein
LKSDERHIVNFVSPGIDAVGIERWEVKAKPMAELLGRWPESVSRWASRGAEIRMGSDDFRADYERLDQILAGGSEGAA